MDRRAPWRLRARTLRRGALTLAVTLAVPPLVSSDPVGAATTTIAPTADAMVASGERTTNYGAASTFLVDDKPRTESYLTFNVPAFSGTVTRATLRLFAQDSTTNGPEVRSAPTTWSEPTLTWANRPSPTGSAVADPGQIAAESWVSFDVTALVKAAGPVGFHLKPDSSDGVTFASREAASNRPELVIETGGTTPPTGGTAQFGATEDVFADEASPTVNFGSDDTLKAQGGSDPDIASYLRFNVSGLNGAVSRATLRLFVINDTVDAPAVLPTSGTWSETGVTWSNRPGPTGAAVADPGAVEKGWVEFDVTGLVPGNGTVNLMLVSTNADSFAARSSEATTAAERPQLVVQTTTTTSTSTTSTSTTSTSTTSTSTTTTTRPPTTTTSSTTSSSTSTTVPPTTTTTTTPGQPTAETGEPWLGLARVTTAPCEPTCGRNVYSLSIEDVSATDVGDRPSDFRYPPGSSGLLRLEWSRTSSSGGTCPTPVAVSMAVSFRRPGGSQIGSTTWTVPIPTTSCSGSATRAIHFDSNPLDGAADDSDYYGVMEVYGRLSGGDEGGADTRGASPADPGTQTGRYARGHLVSGGVMVGWHEDGDDPALLAANEATLGEPFGMVRAYESNWAPPNTRVRNWLADHKYVLWSVKPPHDINGDDDWTPVATGLADDMIRQQVTQLQAWAAAGGVQVGYIFHHEPHDNADLPNVIDDCERPGSGDFPCAGTPVEFVAAYERIRSIIDATGSDRVHLVYTAVLSRAGKTAPGSSVAGSGDEMTFGADGKSVIDFVDYIAHDSYNWYCFRSSCDWEYPDEFGAWGRGVALAEAQNKPLVLAETASHPGCETTLAHPIFRCDRATSVPSPTRDEWIRRIGTWLESDADARRWIVGFAYFHSLHTNDWRFADQTGLPSSGQEGWRDVFTRDTSYNDGLGGHDYFTQYGFNNL